jgi:protein-S-isoprenylcysteine O-methyltransferase Ste14
MDISVWYTVPWVVMIAVWIIGALTARSTARRESAGRRAGHMFLVVLAAWIFFFPQMPRIFGTRVVPDTASVFWIGVAITWIGIAFAIWARLTLGRNWSGMVEVKQEHQLVIAGPYRLVRHPIYSGILLALLGTALGTGELRCFIALPLFFAAWLTKSRHEEEFMRQQFGGEYLAYQSKVKALIPGVI